jgi:hypothetical protein
VVRAVQRHVYVLAELTGGIAGWCVTDRPGEGCPIARMFRGPVVADDWVGRIDPVRSEGLALTRSDVRAVSVAGRVIPPRAEPGLPSGLRAVVVEVEGSSGPTVTIPPLLPGRKPIKMPTSFPHFVPLDSGGRPIVQKPEAGTPVFFEAPGLSWKPPRVEPKGICQLGMVHLDGLIVSAGFVATHVSSFSALIGHPFLSCASNSYTFDRQSLVGSVLVDAVHPGAEPASLPTMKPVYGYRGIFSALGSNGTMLARRIPGAWLVVSGGRGEQQRLAVLRELRASVRLGGI